MLEADVIDGPVLTGESGFEVGPYSLTVHYASWHVGQQR